MEKTLKVLREVKKKIPEVITEDSKGLRRFSSGVLKFDIETAGYDEVRSIADQMLNRKYGSGFYNMIIRYVSEENLGIQFMYLKHYRTPEEIEELKYMFSQGGWIKSIKEQGYKIYAYDMDHHNTKRRGLEDCVLVQKPIENRGANQPSEEIK